MTSVRETKSLGLVIDKDLRFRSHIGQIEERILQFKTNISKRGFSKYTYKTNITIAWYYPMPISVILFMIADMRKLQRLQNACLRLIYRVPRTV